MKSSTNHEVQFLINFLNSVEKMPLDEEQKLIQHLEVMKCKKGAFVLKQNEVENHIKFLVDGIIHQYTLIDDAELTTNIIIPGMAFSSYISFARQKPSTQQQVAITDCSYIQLKKSILKKLLQECRTISRIYLKLFEGIHIKREIRSNILQLRKNRDRIREFLEKDPDASRYLNQVSHKLIAKYLGMTPESFSREFVNINQKC